MSDVTDATEEATGVADAAPATATTTNGAGESDRAVPHVPGARRFVWACVVGGAVAMVVLAWFATRGFAALFDRPALSGFYDAQARALFDGRWDVPPDAASFERFEIGGKYYMYFGPAPALLRMPFLALSDWFDGRLSRVSMIVASLVVVFGIARLSWLARRTVRGDREVSRGELVVAALVVALGSVGTVVPFVSAWTAVYNEAIQWGVAFALVSFGAVVAWLLDGRGRDLLLAAVTAVGALLSRGSVGLGPVAALGIVCAVRAWAALRARRSGGSFDWRTVATLAAATVVPVALYGYVNAAKFGAPFAAPPYAEQDLLRNLPFRAASLADNHDSLVGIRYLPTIVYQYLRPDGLRFDRLFPWVTAQYPTRVLGGVVFDNLRPTASTTATAPLALLFAAGGAVVVVVRRALRHVWLPVLAGALVGVFGTFSVAFIDHRYQGDLVPVLVVPGVVAVWALVAWTAGRARGVVAGIVGLCAVLGLWSVWANLATALVFQRTQVITASLDDRASLVKAQLAVQDALGGDLPSRVTAGRVLPGHGTMGDLFVQGDCDAVYRHDGKQWYPVEQTPATGYHPLVVRLDRAATGRQPVLSATNDIGTTVLWATNAGDGEVALEYEFVPAGPDGPAPARIPLGSVERDPDGSIDVSTRIDGREGAVTTLVVRAGGDVVFDGIVDQARGTFVLGRQDVSPGATTFAGSVRPAPAPTPLCDRLVSMGLAVGRS